MHYTYRAEYVRCGKGCKGCPHGPYWYGYWRDDQGRVRKKYFGKKDPRERKHPHATFEGTAADRRETIFNRRTATVALAGEILGVNPMGSWAEIERKYKALVHANHPDRGGDVRECQYITAAFSFLKAERCM